MNPEPKSLSNRAVGALEPPLERAAGLLSLAALLDNLPGYAYRCLDAPGWPILYASPGVEELTGHVPEAFTSGRVSFGDLMHPEDRERAASESALALAAGQGWALEYRIRHRSGEERWVADRGRGIFDARGALLHLEGLITDVTEHHRLRQELARVNVRLEDEVARRTADLRERTQRLRLVAENVPVMMTYFDAGLRLRFANAAYAKAIGAPGQGAVLGKHLDELLGPDRLPLNRPYFERALRGEPVRYELAGRKRGSLDVNLVPDIDEQGRVLGIFGTLVDITRHKDMEEVLKRAVALHEATAAELRKGEEQLRLVAENIPAAVAHFDAGLVCRYANTRYLEAVGRDRDAVVGAHLSAILPPDRLELGLARVREVLAGRTVEFQRRHYADRGREFDTLLVPFRGPSGQQDGYFVFSVDITERKRAESDRLALEEQLRESQKMEAVGTLAGGIAHDFSNILGVILGNVGLARKDAAGQERLLASLDEIAKAGEQAKRLVQQILAFSRRQPQEMKVRELAPVVREVLGLLRAMVPAVVTLEEHLGEIALHARVDETQVGQVLMNLCANSWQAMEDRTGLIEVRLDAQELAEARAQALGVAPGRYARLSVADDGPGMDEATLARIFEPFFTTKAGKGTGLGLAVVHGIVKGHGGAIEVQSAPGRGTRFDVWLAVVNAPAQPDARPAAQVAAPMPVAAGAGRHVIYVDDNASMVLLVSRMLEADGYRVSGFEGAREALAALEADPEAVDLLVTDHNMPGMSGLELAYEAGRLRPGLPVVVATGFVTDELKAIAATVGVRDVIYKPDTFAELGAAIRAALGSL